MLPNEINDLLKLSTYKEKTIIRERFFPSTTNGFRFDSSNHLY